MARPVAIFARIFLNASVIPAKAGTHDGVRWGKTVAESTADVGPRLVPRAGCARPRRGDDVWWAGKCWRSVPAEAVSPLHKLFILLAFLATARPASAQSPDLGLRGHGGPIRSIVVLDEKTVVTGGFDAAIIVWDIPSGTAKRVLRFHEGAVTALFPFLAPFCVASGGFDARIAIWCPTREKDSWIREDWFKQQHLQNGQSGPIAALAVSGAVGLVSVGWDRQVRFWQFAYPERGRFVGSGVKVEHKVQLVGVAWFDAASPVTAGTKLVSASYDGEIRVTELDFGTETRLLRQTTIPAALNGLAMLPDDRIVLTAADGHVRVLNPDLTPSFEIELPDGPLTAVAVSPDGKTIAVAGMRTPATLIDVATRTVARRILGPGLPVWALAFSTDSCELFTGGADRALRRWTVATGEPVGNPLSPAADLTGKPDSDPGARVFRACAVCHTVKPEDTQRAGPSLHAIMGRRIATAPGYDYSGALKKMDIVWTPETIAKLFELGPTLYTPGTKMPEQRLTDPADRQALVEWLAKVTKPQAAP